VTSLPEVVCSQSRVLKRIAPPQVAAVSTLFAEDLPHIDTDTKSSPPGPSRRLWFCALQQTSATPFAKRNRKPLLRSYFGLLILYIYFTCVFHLATLLAGNRTPRCKGLLAHSSVFPSSSTSSFPRVAHWSEAPTSLRGIHCLFPTRPARRKRIPP
jgi:hypothetical protein